MNEKISVVIPCKNEIENIRACIASARLIADEVLVADSGSQDGTLEAARQLADRVVEREYIDSGDFKNWAIPQAANEWVFILDADERITPDLAVEIKAAARSQLYLAYSVPRRNFFLGHPLDHGDWARDEVTRLIQRDHCRYRLHTDHAEIEVPADQLGRFTSKMAHYTAWDLKSYLDKMLHYANQQADLWYDTGRMPRLWNLMMNAPLRFLRGYVLRFGFLDGMIGFHLSALTAYYSFLKQFLLWQKCYGRKVGDLDVDFYSTQAARVTLQVADVADSDTPASDARDGNRSAA